MYLVVQEDVLDAVGASPDVPGLVVQEDVLDAVGVSPDVPGGTRRRPGCRRSQS